MRYCFIVVYLFITTAQTFGQSYPRKDIDLQALTDEILGAQDEDLNYEDIYEDLLQLLSTPINLNTASVEDIRSINILSEYQIKNFIDYRNENGKLLTEYELQAIPGFDLQTIYKLVPFIKVTDPAQDLDKAFLKRVLKNENHYLLLRSERTLETKKGFTEEDPTKRFLGSQNKYYMRFRTNRTNDFSFGFTMEQDPGEQFAWNPNKRQYGVDFFSFHAQVQNKGRLKNLIVGDYQMQVGQGLLLSGGFGTGKGGETINTTRRSNLMQTPFTSIREDRYMRGASATWQLKKNLFINSFISRTHRDANVSDPTDSLETDDLDVASISTFGFHRNVDEIQKYKKLQENQFGGVLNYKNQSLDAGIVYHAMRFNNTISRYALSVLDDEVIYSFRGNAVDNISAFASYTVRNFNLFGEAAKSKQGGYGTIAGLMGSLTPKFDIALVYRNYQPNFYSLYARTFAESSTPQNEIGYYWGLKYTFNKRYQLSGYMDFFEFPWLRYRSYSPSTGYEWLVRFQYKPTRSITIFAQFREESKQRNLSVDDAAFYQTDNGIKRNFVLNANYNASRTIQLKTRGQFSSYNLGGITTYGMILLQDLVVDFGKIKVSGRYALFDTDDYDNRQYVYEKDVFLAYSMPVFFDTGIRKYVLIQYDINRHFTFWLRYANISYQNRDNIGSNLDEITGNQRNDIKFQLRLRL